MEKEKIESLIKSDTYMGSIVVIYSKGGNGPEGIIADLIYNAEKVPNVPAKLRAIGRLQGLGNSTLYDSEAKWAEGVLQEITRIIQK